MQKIKTMFQLLGLISLMVVVLLGGIWFCSDYQNRPANILKKTYYLRDTRHSNVCLIVSENKVIGSIECDKVEKSLAQVR